MVLSKVEADLAMQLYGAAGRTTAPDVKMPAVGAVVMYYSHIQSEPLPAIVVGMASDPEQAANGLNLHVFYDGPLESQFVRNVSHAPESKHEARTWHWPS